MARRTAAAVVRREIGGIPAYVIRQPGPVRAALIFRVGRADESVPTAGLTHLVEHLALFPFGQQNYGFNGQVDPIGTVFWVEGTTEQVRLHLEQLCRNIADLPLGRLSTEARILVDEASRRSATVADHHGWLRYGVEGVGLTYLREFALLSPDAGAVHGWARTHFSRDNASLVWQGPDPPDLELQLGTGSREPTPDPLDLIRGRVWATGFEDTIGLSFSVQRTSSAAIGQRILARRLQQIVRFDHGVSYGINRVYQPLSSTTALSSIWAGAQRTDVPQMLDAILLAESSFAANGPTNDEIQSDREAQRVELGRPEARIGEAFRTAMQELLGAPPETFEDLEREAALVTVADIQGAYKQAAARAVLTVPQGVSRTGDFARYPELIGGRLTGRHFLNADEPRFAFGRQQRPDLVVGDEGVAILAPRGTGIRIKFSEIAGLVVSPAGAVRLIHSNGSDIFVVPEEWRHGREAVALIESSVPVGKAVRLPAPDGPLTHQKRPRPKWKSGLLALEIFALVAAILAVVESTTLLDYAASLSDVIANNGPIVWSRLAAALIVFAALSLLWVGVVARRGLPSAWMAGSFASVALLVGSLIALFVGYEPSLALTTGSVGLGLHWYLVWSRRKVAQVPR